MKFNKCKASFCSCHKININISFKEVSFAGIVDRNSIVLAILNKNLSQIIFLNVNFVQYSTLCYKSCLSYGVFKTVAISSRKFTFLPHDKFSGSIVGEDDRSGTTDS